MSIYLLSKYFYIRVIYLATELRECFFLLYMYMYKKLSIKICFNMQLEKRLKSVFYIPVGMPAINCIKNIFLTYSSDSLLYYFIILIYFLLHKYYIKC